MDDEILVRQLQQGDRTAFDALYLRYRNDVLRTACLIAGNRTDGEDIAQEAFVQCYQTIGQLRDPARFRAWLFRLMNRAAWKFCKRKRREQPVDAFFETGESAEAALTTVLHTEQNKQLYDAVHGLEQKQRTAIILFYFNDLSVRDIACAMECREGTVKSRLHTARKTLQNVLSADLLEEV